jgi:putative endonuclease
VQRRINGAKCHAVDWYVYIISNNAHTLYVGMTDDLPRRIYEHKTKRFKTAFTARYTFDRCVYFEVLKSNRAAEKREAAIKGWVRRRKIALIQEKNPNWLDLFSSWTESLCLR